MLQATRASSQPGPFTSLGVLDGLRGVAALYVMLGHAVVYLTAPPPAHSPLAVFRSLLDYGQQAVILFFLISGFCIHFRQAGHLSRPDGHARPVTAILPLGSFAWRRARRLYPPLLLALGLTAVLDTVVRRLNPEFFLGAEGYGGLPWYYLLRDHQVLTLASNALMQAGVFSHAYGSNHPLWSLGYEFWFYVFYPALLLASARLGPIWMVAIVTAVSFLAMAASRLLHVYEGLPVVVGIWAVWGWGAFLAEMYQRRVRLTALRWLAPLALLGFVALVMLTERTGGRPGFRDLAWGLCLSVILSWLMLEPSTAVQRAAAKVTWYTAFLGRISYSLYLVHAPWLSLLCAFWLAGNATLPHGLELFVAGAVTSCALGAAAWFFVERHFVSPAASGSRPRGGSRPRQVRWATEDGGVL